LKCWFSSNLLTDCLQICSAKLRTTNADSVYYIHTWERQTYF
jgi:hypothetical protein